MTTMPDNFHFIRLAWLLLAPLAVGLWWLWQRRSDPLLGWREQMAPQLLEALVVGRESAKSGNARWLLVAWVLTIVAQMAAEIGPEIMPTPGDRVDLALLQAGRVLAKGQSGGSILVLADAVDTEPAKLEALRKDLSMPVQFLAIDAPESSQNDSLRAAAKTLGAEVEQIDVEGDDITAIVRRAASAPIAKRGQQGERWQDMGYWLVTPIGLIVLAAFRREEGEDGSA